MKIIGAKLQEFYAIWPMGDCWFCEDGALEVDEEGVLILDPTAMYDIDEAIGIVLWQGDYDQDPPKYIHINGRKIRHGSNGLDIVAAYKAWNGDAVVLVVEALPEVLDAVKAAIGAAGGRVL